MSVSDESGSNAITALRTATLTEKILYYYNSCINMDIVDRVSLFVWGEDSYSVSDDAEDDFVSEHLQGVFG